MSEPAQLQRVTVVDFNMSFWRLVIFMVKAALAAIPAMIILLIIGAIVIAMFKAVTMQLISPTAYSSNLESTPVSYEPPRERTADEKAAVDAGNAAIAKAAQDVVVRFEKDPKGTTSQIRSMLAARDFLGAYQLAAQLSEAKPGDSDLKSLKEAAYNGLLGR